jgi:hypothetical protein
MSDAHPHPTGQAPRSQRAHVEIVLRGSVATVRGVVERIEDRDRIVQALASLDSITGIEDELRPRAA